MNARKASSRAAGRGLVARGALSCLLVLASGCASVIGTAGTGASGGTATAGTGVASTDPGVSPTTVVPTDSGAAASTTAPAAAGGPGACATRDLSAKVGQSQGTAGSTYVNILFTNISQSTCTVYGFPGVSLAGGTPVTQIGLAATESTTATRQLVTLAPGAVGNAQLQIVDAGNYPSSSCAPVTATYLQIYPPNQTTPIYLAFSSQTCSKPVQTLTIGVIQPGTGS